MIITGATITEALHPGLLLVAGGILAGLLRGAARSVVVLGAPLPALWLLWFLPEGIVWEGDFLGYPIAPLAVDRLSRLFAIIFTIMAFGGALFALGQASRLELAAALVYAGAPGGRTPGGGPPPVVV